jgi:hypothetical protein
MRVAWLTAHRDREGDARLTRSTDISNPDSRSMATSGRGSGVVGYDVKVAVDTENHLIVAHEVTNIGTDRVQLANIASQSKEALRAEHLDAVADRGYFNPGDFGLRASQHYSDVAEADDLGREGGWPLRQAGLRSSSVW